MRPIQLILSLAILALITACQPKPKPINYGVDICHHCKMTIVDKKFAAQAVTSKGKIYNFDAIECLVQFIDNRAETSFAYVQVKNFLKPQERLDARSAHYVKSPEIPSPMGAFLSAYEDRSKAEEQAGHPEAVILAWEELSRVVHSTSR